MILFFATSCRTLRHVRLSTGKISLEKSIDEASSFIFSLEKKGAMQGINETLSSKLEFDANQSQYGIGNGSHSPIYEKSPIISVIDQWPS